MNDKTLRALRSAVVAGLLVAGTAPAHGQTVATGSMATAAARLTYADVADLFLDAPLVLTARIVRATPMQTTSASTMQTRRVYLEGDVLRLIRGRGAIATRVAWLADVALDARGRLPQLKKSVVVLAALPVAGRSAEVRLAAGDAMQPWSEAFETRVRSIVAAGLAPNAAPRITGIASAFHVAGTLTGEGETQIFLTGTGAPASLTVLSRPGQARRWAVAFGEIVDEAAAPPAPGTLGWYRLACTLPVELPAAATADLAQAEAQAAKSDYRFVVESLGRCTRTRNYR